MATGLLDLPQDQFMGALDELGIAGARRDELIRAKRNQDSMFDGLFDFFTPQPGMERANLLPMMRPQGMSALDAITSGQAQFAMPGMFTGALTGAAQAIDAPRAAAQGQIPMQDMAGEAANVAGLLTLGGAAAGPGLFNYDPNVAGMGFRAFHGSPHDFDRFDMSKIGTGEGAQAYGHGLYFAENEGVARAYRDALARPYYVTADGVNVADRYGADVVDAFENVGGDPTEITDTINRLRAMVQRNLADFGARDVSELQPQYAGDLASSTIDMARRADGLSALLKSADVRRVNEGRMYEVQINANPEDFLDWDKPFASADDVERFAARFDAVDPALRKRIEDFGYVRQQMGQPMPDGNDIIREVMGGIGSKDAARASQTMREAGIPGIRYLDAGSRGAGDGSRNYVVFDENLIEIVRKYGIAGAAALLGLSQADVAQAMQQQQQPQGLLAGPQ